MARRLVRERKIYDASRESVKACKRTMIMQGTKFRSVEVRSKVFRKSGGRRVLTASRTGNRARCYFPESPYWLALDKGLKC
jgi:hypothetical protein